MVIDFYIRGKRNYENNIQILLTLTSLISLFVFGQAKAGDSEPLITSPDNGSCIVTIVQADKGKRSGADFHNAIQTYLEDGYVAKGNISVAQDIRTQRMQFFINLYKEDC